MFKWRTCFIILGVLGFLFLGFVGFIAWSVYKVMNQHEHFDPKTYKGETGRIQLADSTKSFSVFMVNLKTDKIYTLETQDGSIIAPTGNFMLCSISINETGSDGTVWEANYIPPKPEALSIKSGQTQTLSVDVPLKASINVNQKGDEADFQLAVTNNSNWKCSLRPSPEDRARFQVLSSSGQVLWQGSFEYG